MPRKVDPDAIKKVALAAEEAAGDQNPSEAKDAQYVGRLEEQHSKLQTRYGELQAEFEALRGRKDAEAVKATMMKPYADKTFYFVCVYCGVAFLLDSI